MTGRGRRRAETGNGAAKVRGASRAGNDHGVVP